MKWSLTFYNYGVKKAFGYWKNWQNIGTFSTCLCETGS